MMRQFELIERVERYNPNADQTLLNKAYVYAMQKHGKQVRKSGDPYFSHPLEVAAILTDMRVDDATVATALLHDTIEDTSATRDEISSLFGDDIGTLVWALTKIKKLDLVSKKAEQAENLRKLLLAVSEDVRVLFVKLADRLHNMRTLEHMRPDKQSRIAQETLDIYAPLAGRMGMYDMREQLEELSFRYVNPDAWKTITDRLKDNHAKSVQVIEGVELDLRSKLADGGVEAVVSSRLKRPYSIFRKMQQRSVSFEQLSDIIGFRVIVNSVEDCYRTLGIVHRAWRTVPGRFKDYISTPKQNDYRSLHTTVVGTERQRVELQIRSKAMHEVAEYGIAAHGIYKDASADGRSVRDLQSESAGYAALRKSVESLADASSPEEFLEHTKLELFQDQVFCFTPRGRVIALPRGATPIDFAYAVHTDIGNTCVGCRINGHLMPIATRLSNGDEVEIVCSGAQTPPAAWEELAQTGRARAAIRRANRLALQRQYSGLGEQILVRAFARVDRDFSEAELKASIGRLGQKEVKDVYYRVGRGEIPADNVIRAVYPDYQDERSGKPGGVELGAGWFDLPGQDSLKFRMAEEGESRAAPRIPVRGINGEVSVRFFPGSGAVPGDRIVGILNEEEGITIYPIQSQTLASFDDMPERWMDVRWSIDPENMKQFPALIGILVINEPGTLGEIASAIGKTGANIDTIQLTKDAADFAKIEAGVEVWDVKHLNQVIGHLNALKPVSSVERIFR